MCPGIGCRGSAPDGLIMCVQVLGAAPDGLIMCVQVLGAGARSDHVCPGIGAGAGP